MSTWLDLAASYFKTPASRSTLYILAGAASLGSFACWTSIRKSFQSDKPRTIPPPGEILVSKQEIETLPYPSDALPGPRDVDSPYGIIRLYEWGPEEGPRVLLIHGISTPSIALGGLAHGLVEKGCRVMLFDLFGRGYSSSPNPRAYRYDSALYASQIFICLQSSPIDWRPFTLIGYSLGGAIAADFASYFPHLVQNLVLVASGGLIRTKHISWKSRLLYSTSGLVPGWLIERMVARRLWTGPQVARSIEPEPDTAPKDEDDPKGGLRSQAVYQSSHHGLLPGNPNSTVGKVVDWQLQHHEGFVPAFISSIQYAPIHNQHHRWRILGEHLKKGDALKQVHLVLGENDPIIIADELIADVMEVLGEESVNVNVMKGTGHEVAIEKADEIASLVGHILIR